MNEDLTKVVFFLLWAETHDPSMIFGGHKVGEALEGLASIIGVPVEKLRELI